MQLNPSQLKIMATMKLAEAPDSNIADAMGIPETIVWEVTESPAFREIMEKAREDAAPAEPTIEELRDEIAADAYDTYQVIKRIRDDEKAGAATRLKACEWILAREKTIANMEIKKDDATVVQQLFIDKRASVALARLVGEMVEGAPADGEDWLKMLERSLDEMPPSTA